VRVSRNSNRINGFVLAGGQSSRMGRDKATLLWNDRTLLDHMLDLLSTVADKTEVIGRHPLPDRIPNRGPLGGILTALEHSETDANLVVAVDLPYLTPEFLKYFRDRFEKSNQSVLACRVGGRIPLCLGLRRPVLDEVHRRLEGSDWSVHGFVNACKSELITQPELEIVRVEPSIFRNINSPDDLVR